MNEYAENESFGTAVIGERVTSKNTTCTTKNSGLLPSTDIFICACFKPILTKCLMRAHDLT